MKSRSFHFRHTHTMHLHAVARQQGVMLIEALCAILIFSFGVIGLIGLQTSATTQSTDAKYRTIAAELADRMINQIWVSNRATLTYSTVLEPQFASTGAVYLAWLGNTTTPGTVMGSLPGVTSTTNAPTVAFGSVFPSGCSLTATVPIACTLPVTVTVQWQSPKDAASGTVHSYTANAQITLN